ncbi:MAG TPA: type II CAAX endopeptidase family protein [Aggregatilineaceae bacterium]|nr:type II CAAX endopeptidase family protein [Aggregatilineaceae bacterium]
MDTEIVGTIIIYLVIYVFLGIVVSLANYADKRQSASLRTTVQVLLMLINVLFLGSIVLSASATSDNLSQEEEVGAIVAAGLVVAATSALLLRRVRERLVRLFPRYQGEPNKAKRTEYVPTASIQIDPTTAGTPLFPQMLDYYTTGAAPALTVHQEIPSPVEAPISGTGGGFNPASIVHMVAMIYCLYFFGSQLTGFILSGGLEGIAEDFAEGLTIWSLLLTAIPQLAIPIMGVGVGVRRNWREVFERLGLKKPTLQDVGIAIGVTIALFIFLVAASAIWSLLESQETIEEQQKASEALGDSINTIWLVLLVSVLAAVGEEIAFRGALQPIFGLWPTAILFAAIHLQYTLTPASLIILVVALTFGWLRMRYSTTTSIFTHFFYNFFQLAIALAATEESFVWFIHHLF